MIAYFGDGATAQGDVNEAFVFASVQNAPVVFFCQNNQWAISEPNDKQTRVPLYQRASGFGFPGVRVDGNDVVAVYAVTKAAMDHAREGNGPTFVEAFTYRMGAHTTSDDPTRYRVAAEVEVWKQRDPIVRLRTYLERQGMIDEAFLADLEREVGRAGRAHAAGLPVDARPHAAGHVRPHLRRPASAGGRGAGPVRRLSRARSRARRPTDELRRPSPSPRG